MPNEWKLRPNKVVHATLLGVVPDRERYSLPMLQEIL